MGNLGAGVRVKVENIQSKYKCIIVFGSKYISSESFSDENYFQPVIFALTFFQFVITLLDFLLYLTQASSTSVKELDCIL